MYLTCAIYAYGSLYTVLEFAMLALEDVQEHIKDPLLVVGLDKNIISANSEFYSASCLTERIIGQKFDTKGENQQNTFLTI